MCRIYPNGQADVNHFHAAGGMAKLTSDLLSDGLIHGDAKSVTGGEMTDYANEPYLTDNGVEWREGAKESGDTSVLANIADPFSKEGGMMLMQGNLGRAVMKISAVDEQHRVVEAPARVFTDQEDLQKAFKAGELSGDMVAVVLFQGPAANGMPELHKLTPPLGVLQDMGFKVALVTDGRMSGASGKVPAAIHVSPECLKGGELAKVRDGDIVLVDGKNGILEAKVDPDEWAKREPATPDLSSNNYGIGRELFVGVRNIVTTAEEGASFVTL
jgi:phosphogluconate dehydratase